MIAGYALHEPDAVDLVTAAGEGRIAGVPIVFGVGGIGEQVIRVRRALLAAGIAVAADPRGVAAATGALLADARARAGEAVDPQIVPGSVPTGVSGPYEENQAEDLLDRLEITTPPRRACADRAATHAALGELGGPVAVKILDAVIPHKTEIGGVHLDIRIPAARNAALDTIDTAGARRYLVELMAPAGVELMLGARRDPIFGPIVVLGLGGATAEAPADVAVRLAPLSAAQAADMLGELAGRALADRWRGGPVVDADELGRVVTMLGDLLVANLCIGEIEINPLRLIRDGLVALDAVIIGGEADDAQPDQ